MPDEPPPAVSVARRIRDPALVALLVVAGTLVGWARLPPVARATLWAEDSRNFLGNAVTDGPVAPLFRVYAGYLHTVPRLIAGTIVQLVPIAEWAQAMALGSCLVVAVVAATVFVCARAVVEPWPWRLALAVITLLAPLTPREVLGNTANLHWYFLWLTPWLIVYRSRTRPGTVLLTVVAALAALTEIQMAVFLPLLIVLLLIRRQRVARLPVAVALLAGGALQVIATLSSPRGHGTAAPLPPLSIAYGWLIDCVMPMWTDSTALIGRALVGGGAAAALACLVPVVAAAVWVAVAGSAERRLVVAVLLASSIVFWVAAVTVTPGSYLDFASEAPAKLGSPWLSRYGVVPSMELLAVVVLGLATRRPAREGAQAPARRRRTRWAGRILVGAVAALIVATSFVPSYTRKWTGPELAPQVTAAAEKCEGKPATTPVTLVAPPHAGWKIHLDCAWFPGGAAPAHGILIASAEAALQRVAHADLLPPRDAEDPRP